MVELGDHVQDGWKRGKQEVGIKSGGSCSISTMGSGLGCGNKSQQSGWRLSSCGGDSTGFPGRSDTGREGEGQGLR